MNNLLYIDLSGYAGSGKDTVAKMLSVMLNKDFNDIEEFKTYYNNIYKGEKFLRSATYDNEFNNGLNSNKVLCIAYADQLKYVCSSIFGINVERFYMNKSTSWICINKTFAYTEIRPDDNDIITAEEYFYDTDNYKKSKRSYYMSLREILVYVGTYVLQENINKSIFVNIVRNKITEISNKNPNLKYVIITDNRFSHELDYMQENNGILISISRNTVTQLNNIAEHELDDESSFDYIINNSGSYDDLIIDIWNIVHDNHEFENETYLLQTRENVNNYIRVVDEHTLKICTKNKVQKIYHENGEIRMIDPIGGPTIYVDKKIELRNSDKIFLTKNIEFDNINEKFIIKI